MIRALPFVFFALLVACQPFAGSTNSGAPATGIRALNETERLQDFDALVDTFRNYYGPLAYKEKRFGFTLDGIANDYRERVKASKSDLETFGIYAEFTTRFQDGHVSLHNNLIADQFFAVPLAISPFGDKAIIVAIKDPSLTADFGINLGDEVLKVDGKAPAEYMPIIKKYLSYANDVSTAHAISRVLKRPLFMTDLLPTKNTVELTIQKADGTILERSLVWEKLDETNDVKKSFVTTPSSAMTVAYSPLIAEILKGSLLDMGAEKSFFATAQVQAKFKTIEVKPSAAALARFGIANAAEAPALFAMLYKFEGKNILLLRQATYLVSDKKARISWFKALLSEYANLADVLVIDQTHNPGGDVTYALEFMSLFANQKTYSLVNFLNGDRRWLDFIGDLLKDVQPKQAENQEFVKTAQLAYKTVEQAYDNGGGLTKTPVPLLGFNYVNPENATEGKPVLLLINELAGSCGDVFPALMKANKLAILFGKRTMGLGGNVETFMKLPNSRVELNLTRGLFAVYSPEGNYPEDRFIENNGVTPDIEYDVTAEDFRAGYVNYFESFSKAAVQLVK